MGWTSDEPKVNKKGMETSSKILLAIISCLLLIIILIIVLIINIDQSTYTVTIDGVSTTNISKDTLLTKSNNITYVNIEEFAKLVKYEYHEGEYKAYTIEQDKCYVQGTYETASFYLNENKVYKLPINEMNSSYNEFLVENVVKEINGKMYVPIDAIGVAFNVQITEQQKSLTIFTLDYLVKWYDTKVKEWGYTGLSDLNFENQKSLLYNYFIVKKEKGLYKIIDSNQKEIVSDKYTKIEFSENTKEFFVTNNLGQVGIINLDGTTKIEPIYNSISLLDKEKDLYIVQKDTKYGVIKSGNIIVINPEYDAIGSTLTSVEINGTKKEVNPVVTIEVCEGIVVKKDNKYGVVNIEGNIIVPIQVDSIYSTKNDEEELEYFMIYNGEELNIVDMLIEQGLIEDTSKKEENNTVTNQNTVDQFSNTLLNNVVQ